MTPVLAVYFHGMFFFAQEGFNNAKIIVCVLVFFPFMLMLQLKVV